jgi:hypothetical protein
MKAIIISVENRLMFKVDLSDSYEERREELEKILGYSCMTVGGYLNEHNVLYVDDNGLLKDPTMFIYAPTVYPEMLAGNGVIIGVNDEGETVDCTVSLKEVSARVAIRRMK